MKLSSYKGEDAIELTADLMEPVGEIIGDPDVKEAWSVDKDRMKGIKLALKNHKKAVLKVLAILDGVPAEDEVGIKAYGQKVSVFTLPAKLVELTNDEDFTSLFISQGRETEETSTGSAMPNIEVNEN
ncbi:MAG: hypothetical protein K5637_01980 [Lachnospiraceae bacterium]|nr:hypothetical protein [Lachnospiraceae bacterium]